MINTGNIPYIRTVSLFLIYKAYQSTFVALRSYQCYRWLIPGIIVGRYCHSLEDESGVRVDSGASAHVLGTTRKGGERERCGINTIPCTTQNPRCLQNLVE